MTDFPQDVALPDAALRLKRSYWQTRELLFRGELAGHRDARGRWRIDLASLDRFTAAK